LDFETTVIDPVDPKQMNIVEVGAVLWDTKRNYPLLTISRLVWDTSYTFSERMTEITGLTHKDLLEYGTSPKYALEKLVKLMGRAEAIVAHNGQGFDKVVLECEGKRHGIEIPEMPWIDTCFDVPYPKKIETRKLDFLAPAHGFLNPFAHRALFDVLSMLKVLSHYDFDKILEQMKIPSITVRAMSAKPFGPTAVIGAKQNEFAKSRGYRFHGETKAWVKTIKEPEFETEVAACKHMFPVIEVKK
jgi:DNA polymerase-3 subunit epsilon